MCAVFCSLDDIYDEKIQFLMRQRDRNKLDEKGKVDSQNMTEETDKLTRIRTNRCPKDTIMFLCTRSKKKSKNKNKKTISACLQKYINHVTLLGLKSRNRCKRAIRAADECEDFERE